MDGGNVNWVNGRLFCFVNGWVEVLLFNAGLWRTGDKSAFWHCRHSFGETYPAVTKPHCKGDLCGGCAGDAIQRNAGRYSSCH